MNLSRPSKKNLQDPLELLSHLILRRDMKEPAILKERLNGMVELKLKIPSLVSLFSSKKLANLLILFGKTDTQHLDNNFAVTFMQLLVLLLYFYLHSLSFLF